MTADVKSAAAGDATNPQGLATIPEDSQYADTANAKEMDANDEETTENSKPTKSHILVTTANSTCSSNAIEEMRAERLAMAIKNKAIRDEQTEQTNQMMAMLKKTQQMMTNSNYFQGPPSFNPIQPQQQFEHQCEPTMTNSNYFQGLPSFNPTQPQQQFEYQCEPMMTNANYFQGPPSFNPIQPHQHFEHPLEPMVTNSDYFQGPPSFNPTQPQPQQPFEHRREQPLAHQQQQHHHSQQPSQHQHSPQESPPKLQQLKRKSEKLDYLDKRLLDLPLANRSDQKSHDQTAWIAWINVVTPTDRQAKPDAADKIQRTPRDIRQFFIQPATPRPPAEPDPASRPLVKQAAPGPLAEPVPAPRPPAKHARAISDFFIQPAAPRPPPEPDPTPCPRKAEAADKIHKTQRDIREFLIRPAAQPAAPCPRAEHARPAAAQPRHPAEQAHARQPIPRLRDG